MSASRRRPEQQRGNLAVAGPAGAGTAWPPCCRQGDIAGYLLSSGSGGQPQRGSIAAGPEVVRLPCPNGVRQDIPGCWIRAGLGATVTWDTELDGHDRFYSSDPFGNRLEFLQPRRS